jgi:hypothetical protein
MRLRRSERAEFIEIFRSLPTFRGDALLSTWIGSTASIPTCTGSTCACSGCNASCNGVTNCTVQVGRHVRHDLRRELQLQLRQREGVHGELRGRLHERRRLQRHVPRRRGRDIVRSPENMRKHEAGWLLTRQ